MQATRLQRIVAIYWMTLGATGAAVATSYAVRRATVRVRWYLTDTSDDITTAVPVALPILALCLWAAALLNLVRSCREEGHSVRLSAWASIPVVAILLEAAALSIG